MAALLYFSIILITFYIGGVYRNTPLIVLSFTEAAFFVLMLITALISLLGTSCRFKKDINYGYKNTRLRIPAAVSNRAFFPINKGVLFCKYFYTSKKENKAEKTLFSAEGRSEKRIYIDVTGKHCGILKVSAFRIKGGDHFNLFRISRKISADTDIVVLPAEKALNIYKESNIYLNDISDNTHSAQGDSQEIYQIRPYRSGDSFKNIHWNISARTDELYYKEFTDTGRETIKLYVDMKDMDREDLKRTDAFYELCSAVILGLLENMGNIDVYWTDNDAVKNITLTQRAQLRSLLTELYYSKASTSRPYGSEDRFVFNKALELYFGNKLIYRFSEDNYEEEITTGRFAL